MLKRIFEFHSLPVNILIIHLFESPRRPTEKIGRALVKFGSWRYHPALKLTSSEREQADEPSPRHKRTGDPPDGASRCNTSDNFQYRKYFNILYCCPFRLMMPAPHPLFDTYSQFVLLSSLDTVHEPTSVMAYLGAFAPELQAPASYRATKLFLKSYAGNEATFNAYRTQVERLLLWSLLIAKRPILMLRRSDAEAFLEFCLSPPKDWVGGVTRSRFVSQRLSEDQVVANPTWKPFVLTAPKYTEPGIDTPPLYAMSQRSLTQAAAVCGAFYAFAIGDALTTYNPFNAVKQKSRYKDRAVAKTAEKTLSPLQWDYVLDTATGMADQAPKRYERSLFLVATLYAMYLRVSDLVGRSNWMPTMGDFRRDEDGNWWFYVVGKGNKAAKIAVRESYVERFLMRYRRFLGLSPLPYANERTPLLTTRSGRAGLCERHVRALIQEVFDESVRKMLDEQRGEHEVANLRHASTHWLRHTSATFDAPFRDPKDLQADMRHTSLSTTQDIYYNAYDSKRARSVRDLPMDERD